ncbi:serine/threonine-protein kinase [Actinomadura gamaensis]|uniref:non-specific serine/threonine protein kinase n=1 Tax=Actinomadura gamaensis TaxID=1763541 RepID=A0ABV9U0T0_9ACTN
MKLAGRYETEMPLAVGGMGEIWEATDLRLARSVAVKLIADWLHGDSERARRRFYREARVLARLHHQGVPALYDFGDEGGTLFMVMELVSEAVTLRDMIAERGTDLLPVPWVALIGAQLCAALSAAHQAGLVHRDLTPSNIVFGRDGTAHVLDFGVAAAMAGRPSDFSTITRPGEAPGSLFYTAPELDGYQHANVATDLYSVGCVLYELLAGHRVFVTDTVMDEAMRHQSDEEAPPLSRDDVPDDLEQLIYSLLSKNPDDRPASGAVVSRALLAHAKDFPPLPGFYEPLPDAPEHLYATALAALPK